MELNVHVCTCDGDPLSDPTFYRHLVGNLIYLGVTRPDIFYHVHILSQFVSTPNSIHYSHLMPTLRYLCGTICHHLLFPNSSSKPIWMLRGLVILQIVVHFLLTFLMVLLPTGRRRNRLHFLL